MLRCPPRSTRTVAPFPYPTLFRSPTGVAMSLHRRTALLDFARRHHAVIVEDDYDGEFRFGGRPLDALQTLDRDALVFYVGTFRSEEHTSELQSLMRISYAVFCLKKKIKNNKDTAVTTMHILQ